MANPAVIQIAILRGCNGVEARAFCLQVQKLCKGSSPSFKCIAQAIQQLELEHQSYTEQDVAELAKKLYASQPRARKRRKRRRGSVPKPPQYKLSPKLSDEIRKTLQKRGVGADEGWYE